MRRLRPLSVAVLAVGLAAPAFVAHPAAAADRPCWHNVLQDWTSGQLQRRYAAHCYTAALDHLPTDVRMYSNAADDIHRALLAALRHDPPSGGGANGSGTPGAARRRAVVGSAGVPLPIVALATLMVTLAALALVGLLRMRRGTSREAPAPRE